LGAPGASLALTISLLARAQDPWRMWFLTMGCVRVMNWETLTLYNDGERVLNGWYMLCVTFVTIPNQ
jgi:hypothetical protein